MSYSTLQRAEQSGDPGMAYMHKLIPLIGIVWVLGALVMLIVVFTGEHQLAALATTASQPAVETPVAESPAVQ